VAQVAHLLLAVRHCFIRAAVGGLTITGLPVLAGQVLAGLAVLVRMPEQTEQVIGVGVVEAVAMARLAETAGRVSSYSLCQQQVQQQLLAQV